MADELYGIQDWTDVELWGEEPIVAHYPDEDSTFTPSQGSVVRTYRVPYAKRQMFVWQMLGYPYLEFEPAEGVGPTIGAAVGLLGNPAYVPVLRRRLPERIENWVDENELEPDYFYALDASCSPLAGGGDLDTTMTGLNGHPYRTFDYALVRVTFGSPVYDIMTWVEAGEKYSIANLDFAPEAWRFTKRTRRGKANLAVTEHGMWKYNIGQDIALADLPQVGNKVGIPDPDGGLSVEWYDVLPEVINEPFLDSMLGRTNIDKFYNVLPETLIFNDYEIVPARTMFGRRTVMVRFDFGVRPKGVNKRLAPRGNEFVDIVNTADRNHKPVSATHMYHIFNSIKYAL